MGKGAGIDCEQQVFKRARRRSTASLPPIPVASWSDIEVTAIEKFVYDEETGDYPDFQLREPLRLERDPDNAADANCINVYRVVDGSRLGYVSKEHNEPLAAALDEGRVIKVRISRVEGPQRSENNQLRWRAGRIWADFVAYSG